MHACMSSASPNQCTCRKAAEQARTHLQEMLQQELKHRRSAEAEVAAQRKRLLELEASHISSQGALQKQVRARRRACACNPPSKMAHQLEAAQGGGTEEEA